jgi:hypothetical protein
MQQMITRSRLLLGRPRVQAVILALTTIVITTKNITLGDFRYPDAWAHAMNGVYLLDLIRAMPFDRFWDFTLSYFAKYPAISLPYHPPGFPILEAVVFAVMGVSALAARSAVVLCAVAAMIGWYNLVRGTHNRTIAFTSGLLILTNAAVVVASRQVMLEVPTMAAIVIAVFFLHKAVESESISYLYCWAIAAGASVWVKQQAAFIVPFSISYLLLRWKFFRPPLKHLLASTAIVATLVTPIWFMAHRFARFALLQVVGGTRRYGFEKGSADDLLYYFRQLPKVVPVWVLALAVGGVAVIVWQKQYHRNLLYGLWFLWAYAIIAGISAKDGRYMFFLIPPLYLFACAFVDKIDFRVKGLKVVNVLMTCLCLLQCGFAYSINGPILCGYAEAAHYVKANWKGKTVVISASYHGNFTFNVRRLDPQGSIMVLRAEKVLPQIIRSNDKVDEQLLYQSLRDLGTKYVVVESGDRKIVPEMTRLRHALETGNFALRKRIATTGSMKSFEGVDILIYEYLGEVDGSKKFMDMRMPKMRGVLKIPLQ